MYINHGGNLCLEYKLVTNHIFCWYLLNIRWGCNGKKSQMILYCESLNSNKDYITSRTNYISQLTTRRTCAVIHTTMSYMSLTIDKNFTNCLRYSCSCRRYISCICQIKFAAEAPLRELLCRPSIKNNSPIPHLGDRILSHDKSCGILWSESMVLKTIYHSLYHSLHL